MTTSSKKKELKGGDKFFEERSHFQSQREDDRKIEHDGRHTVPKTSRRISMRRFPVDTQLCKCRTSLICDPHRIGADFDKAADMFPHQLPYPLKEFGLARVKC
ncbi:hypothetical protein H2248_001608 [Termitomyces sp. 'cryptogamus']|nr:hypothetical protein H2248_001608 [Termitomyces sp. 'cryptogamus']